MSIKNEIYVIDDEYCVDNLLKPIRHGIPVEVNEWDKVEDLKKKIMETMERKGRIMIGTDPKTMTLRYGQNEDMLKDEKTIDDYPIKNGDFVFFSIVEFRVFVQYKTENEEKNYPIWVKREETVATLKKKIKSESGIEPDDQMLKKNTRNGPELEDKNTLNDYGIAYGTTTIILLIEFEGVVEYVPDKHWNKYTIMVKKTDILATMKDTIREKYTEDYNEYGFGTIELVKEFKTDEREPFVSLDDVVLWHEDLDEYKTMEQCGIREGSMVSVFYARRLTKEEHDQGY